MDTNLLTLKQTAEILQRKDTRTIQSYVQRELIPKIAYDKASMTINALLLAKEMGVENFDEPFIDEAEARKILGLEAKRSIENYCQTKGINMYRLTNHVRYVYFFRKSDLEKFLQLHLQLLPFSLEGMARRHSLYVINNLFESITDLFGAPRAFEIFCLYLQGENLEEISKKFNLARERIRQIIEKTRKRIEVRTPRIKEWIDVFKNTEYFLEDPNQILKMLEENKMLKNKNLKLQEALAECSGENEIPFLLDSEAELELIKVEDLELSVRVFNFLKAEHINTLWQITQQSRKKLLKLRNAGRKSVNELERMLRDRELALAD